MRIRNLWLVLLLLLLPLPLSGQRDGRDHDRDDDDRGAVERLLRHRSELGLTDGQVAQLQRIEQRMEEKNAPLIAELVRIRRELRGDGDGRRRDRTSEQRREMRRRMEAARPLMRQIRENSHAAMREVGGVLTDPQKARVREMLRERRDRHDDDDRRGSRRRGG